MSSQHPIFFPGSVTEAIGLARSTSSPAPVLAVFVDDPFDSRAESWFPSATINTHGIVTLRLEHGTAEATNFNDIFPYDVHPCVAFINVLQGSTIDTATDGADQIQRIFSSLVTSQNNGAPNLQASFVAPGPGPASALNPESLQNHNPQPSNSSKNSSSETMNKKRTQIAKLQARLKARREKISSKEEDVKNDRDNISDETSSLPRVQVKPVTTCTANRAIKKEQSRLRDRSPSASTRKTEPLKKTTEPLNESESKIKVRLTDLTHIEFTMDKSDTAKQLRDRITLDRTDGNGEFSILLEDGKAIDEEDMSLTLAKLGFASRARLKIVSIGSGSSRDDSENLPCPWNIIAWLNPLNWQKTSADHQAPSVSRPSSSGSSSYPRIAQPRRRVGRLSDLGGEDDTTYNGNSTAHQW